MTSSKRGDVLVEHRGGRSRQVLGPVAGRNDDTYEGVTGVCFRRSRHGHGHLAGPPERACLHRRHLETSPLQLGAQCGPLRLQRRDDLAPSPPDSVSPGPESWLDSPRVGRTVGRCLPTTTTRSRRGWCGGEGGAAICGRRHARCRGSGSAPGWSTCCDGREHRARPPADPVGGPGAPHRCRTGPIRASASKRTVVFRGTTMSTSSRPSTSAGRLPEDKRRSRCTSLPDRVERNMAVPDAEETADPDVTG